MDALSDVLRVAHLTGGVFLHAEFFAPWCIASQLTPEDCSPFLGETSHLILYHYVVEGELQVGVIGEENETFVLGPGEVVLLPRNDRHLLGSDLSLPPVESHAIIHPPERDGLYAIHHGGNGARTRLVCGFLGCDGIEGNPVLSTLPAVLHLDVEEGGAAEWIRSTFQFAADEVAAGRPGSETVLAKLSELLFVEAVRRYAESLPEGRSGWLAGLRDPYVARALALFHRELEPVLDDGRSRPGGGAFAIGVGRAIYTPHRRCAHALPCELADATCGAATPRHRRLPCSDRRGGRL